MISHRTARFREAFDALPVQVQRQARDAYKLFACNPYHPGGLHSKQAHPSKPVYSVRVSGDYRAVGIRDG